MKWRRGLGGGPDDEPDPDTGPPRQGRGYDDQFDDESRDDQPRDERAGGFTRGGKWAERPPSAALVRVLDALSGPGRGSPGGTDEELVGMAAAWAAVESWAGAGKLGVIRELVRRQDQPWQSPADDDHADVTDPWTESLTHNLALALAASAGSAERAEWLAWELGTRLRGIGALLAGGTVNYGKAKAVAEAFQHLSDDAAACAEALIIGQLKGKTYLQVLHLAQRAAAQADPGGAERRRKDAEKHSARVRLWREQSGAAGLGGFDLPADETLAAHDNIGALADQYKASKAFPGAKMDQLRAMAYLDLLNSVTAEDRITHARTRADSATPGSATPGSATPGSGVPDPADPLSQPGSAGPADPAATGPAGPPATPGTPDGVPDYGRDDGDDDGSGEDDGSGDDDGGGPDDGSGPDDNNGDGSGGPDYGSGSDDDGGGSDGPGSGGGSGDGSDGPGNGSGSGDGDGPGSGNGLDADDGDDGDPRGGGGPGSGGSAPDPSPSPSPSPGPRVTARPGTDLIIPLMTLLGLGNRPGEAYRLGPLDPGLCRKLAALAANSPATEYCLTITDDHGYAIGHGCARTRLPHMPRSSTATADTAIPGYTALAARVNLTIPLTDLQNLTHTIGPASPASPASRGSRGSPWALTPRHDDHGPPGGHGTWTLTIPGGRELTVRTEPVPTFDCDHARESRGYQPSDTLRHLVQVRDGTCTFPACTRHARESDFEHAIPYHKGGRTCGCNAGARSRKCHRIKQSKGWNVTQPRPGWHQWTTPTGHTYTQEPKRYPA